jgi:hypothetical protein
MMRSRDVCTPRALLDQDERRWTIRYCGFDECTRDRANLHSEIAANPVQGSSTVTGSHEGEGGAWRLLIFSSESRRPDIPRQDSLTRSSGRPMALTQRMNVRPCIGSAVPACAIHSFLGGGDKQLVELWRTKAGPSRQLRRRADGTGRPLLCRFSDAGMPRPFPRSDSRRPKSAKAGNRGVWGSDGAAGAMGIWRRRECWGR